VVLGDLRRLPRRPPYSGEPLELRRLRDVVPSSVPDIAGLLRRRRRLRGVPPRRVGGLRSEAVLHGTGWRRRRLLVPGADGDYRLHLRRRVRLVVGGSSLAGIALQVGSYVWQAEVDLDELDGRQVAQDVGAVVLVFAVLGYIVVSMFPADIVQGGSTTNIIAHAMGFLLGVGVSIMAKGDPHNLGQSLPEEPDIHNEYRD